MDARDENGCTPLVWASLMGRREVVQLLLLKSAGVNTKDKYDRTALHWAAMNHRKEIVELLLRNGAHVNAKNKLGQSPLDETVNTEVKQLLKNCVPRQESKQ